MELGKDAPLKEEGNKKTARSWLPPATNIHSEFV